MVKDRYLYCIEHSATWLEFIVCMRDYWVFILSFTAGLVVFLYFIGVIK